MKLRTKSEQDTILEAIFSLYPNKTIELDFETPFQLLAAVMLSAQMTDKGVNKATKRLFELVKTPADLLKLEPEKVEVMLRGVNYYRVKTKHIFMTAEKLKNDLLSNDHIFQKIASGFIMGKVSLDDLRKVFRGETV